MVLKTNMPSTSVLRFVPLYHSRAPTESDISDFKMLIIEPPQLTVPSRVAWSIGFTKLNKRAFKCFDHKMLSGTREMAQWFQGS